MQDLEILDEGFLVAPHLQTLQDREYTLAGKVNEDSLYVGGDIKAKLSLPVLSTLGAVTSSSVVGDHKIFKHTNGTTLIKGGIYDLNKPDSRISMGIYADKDGLQYYNDTNDPMPIKTRNMAGLQKWEETDDYIIYVDKDAVMTTVQSYVTGTYDLFLERKNLIDSSMELLKDNDIKWTHEDDSKLLLDINEYQLQQIANMPVTLEDEQVQTYSTKTVPTTYEACFRTDKKTGEIYIGEGYENLIKKMVSTSNVAEFTVEGCKIRATLKAQGSISNLYIRPLDLENDSLYTMSCIRKSGTGNFTMLSNVAGFAEAVRVNVEELNLLYNLTALTNSMFENTTTYGMMFQMYYDSDFLAQITKTSSLKPFVNSVMPTGKLAFVSEATSESHSFVLKVVSVVTEGTNYVLQSNWKWSSSLRVSQQTDILSKKYILASSEYRKTSVGACALDADFNKDKVGFKFASIHDFKQLLIYKGVLTKTELETELEKNITLTTYTPQENSVPNTFLLESFESMRNYTPALTDAEIIEECALDVQPLFRNSNGIPNHLGEDLPTEDGRKALVIGGSYKSNLDAGVFYNSFEYDTNDQPDDVGTRVVYK